MSSTEPPLPVPEDDALDAAASAVVDGVASPDEAALVAASPEGEARVAALRAVAGAVGRPVPDQDPAAASRALAAALATFDAGDAAGAEAASAAAGEAPPAERTQGSAGDARATVTPLHPPPGRAGPSRWPSGLTLVAAALAVLLGIGVVVGVLGGDDDSVALRANKEDNAASEAVPPPPPHATMPPGAVDPATAGATAGGAPAAGPLRAGLPSTTFRPAPTTAAPFLRPVVDGGDVGSQSDLQALAQRAAAALDSTPDPATTGRTGLPTDVQACVIAGPGAAGEPVGALRYRAVGTFQGTPAVVLAYDRPGAPARLLVVLARSGCTRLASTPF